jgi:hypothetical protein
MNAPSTAFTRAIACSTFTRTNAWTAARANQSARSRISYEADLPAQYKGFYSVNVEFFDGLGSPGGASRTGRIGRDHPAVAALPPQR